MKNETLKCGLSLLGRVCRVGRWLALGAGLAILVSCGGGGVGDVATGQIVQLAEVGVTALALKGEAPSSLIVFPGGTRTVGLGVDLVEGGVESELSFEIFSGGAYATLFVDPVNRRKTVSVNAIEKTQGEYNFVISVKNLKSGKTALVPFNLVVTDGQVVGAGKIATDNSTTSITTLSGEVFQFHAVQLKEPVGIQIIQTSAANGTLINRFQFDRDIVGTGLAVTLPADLPDSAAFPVGYMNNSFRTVLKNTFSSVVGKWALSTPYESDPKSTGLGKVWSEYEGWFLDGGDYRVPAGTLIDFQKNGNGGNLGKGSYYFDEVTRYAAASRLTSTVSKDENLYGNNAEPVLFIHGFNAKFTTARLGGGPDTFANFPALVSQGIEVPAGGGRREFLPFEFQWATNARFQDVVVDLAKAINTIHAKTGKKVHIVAHSFGGVLSRSLLQKIHNTSTPDNARRVGEASDAVASLLTLGSPHSGIFDSNGSKFVGYGQEFPQGQDAASFEGCGAITCHQMGEYVAAIPTDLLKVNDKAGEIAAKLHQTLDRLPAIPIVVGIGLNRYSAFGDNTKYSKGDGLISYQGQRFSPEDGVSQLRQGVKVGRATLYEAVMGVAYNVLPGWIVRPEDLGIRQYGYVHSTDTGASNVSILGEKDGEPRDSLTVGVEASPRLNCGGIANRCEHAGYLLFKHLMQGRYCAFLTGGICVASVADAFGSVLGYGATTTGERFEISGTISGSSAGARTVEIFDGDKKLGVAEFFKSALGVETPWRFVSAQALSDGFHDLKAVVTWSGTDAQATAVAWAINVRAAKADAADMPPGLLNLAPIAAFESLTTPLAINSPITGSIRVTDPGDQVKYLRVHVGRALNGSDCQIDIGAYNELQAPGVKAFSGCASMTTTAGNLFLKLEASDSKGLSAEVVRTVVVVSAAPVTPPTSTIEIPATAFTNGTNVALSTNGYGLDTLMNAPPYGTTANAADWIINVPVAGRYELFAEYAAAVSRPVIISFDGAVKFSNALATVTGGWFPANRSTLSQGVVDLPAGATTMRVSRSDVFPHIRGFKLVPLSPITDPASPSWCDQSLSFEGNVLPGDWSQAIIRSGPGVRTNRLEAYPTDSGSMLESGNGPIPSYFNSVVVEYDSFRTYSYWGQFNNVEFKTAAGKRWRFYDVNAEWSIGGGNRRFASGLYTGPFHFDASSIETNYQQTMRSMGLGTFRNRLTVKDGSATWVATDASGVATTVNMTMPPEFRVAEFVGAGITAYTTTDGSTWIDNVSIKCWR